MTRSSRSSSIGSARTLVRLLGPVAVEVEGSPLTVDTRKAVALLAYLAVTRRPASRDALATLLWPEADGADARGALRRTLSVLRAGLGEPGLIVDRSTVALDATAFDVDTWRFEAALAIARGHQHPGGGLCPECLGALQEAAALDRGEFLAGFALRDSPDFEDWQLAEAASFRRELAAVLERLARGQAAARAWDAAATVARRWLELDPLHEPAHRLLMEVLARSGEPAAALAQYRDCVRILDRELGVAPLTETADLAEAIRSGRYAVVVDARPQAGQPPTASQPTGQRPAAPPPAGQPPAGVEAPRSERRSEGGTASEGEDLVDRSPLVGRDRELRRLVAALDAVGPAGRLLVVEGEPGIGKTRLARAAADVVRDRGGSVLEARAYPGEAGIAFAPIVELIRAGLGRPDAVERLAAVRPDLLGEVARLVPLPVGPSISTSAPSLDPYGQARLFEALAKVLATLASGPVSGLIWLDDLSWADASTLELIGYIARRLPDHPLALLVTFRVEELVAGGHDRVVGPPDREGLVVGVELGRLRRADVAELATATLGPGVDAGRIDALFERSEGLPLYLIEALAAPGLTDDAIPAGVAALLRARLDSVGELAAQVLSAAAVIGRSFDFRIVRAASGRSDEETVDGLDEAVGRGLVREIAPEGGGDIRYDFTHGRLRDVAYQRMSLARRRLLHARVADALRGPGSELTPGFDRWSLIAYHETLAGRSAQAAEAHRQAGDHARSVFANAEAREHLEAALALGSPAQVELRGALGEVLMLLGDYDGALAHLEAAVALAEPDEEAAIEHRIGLVLARRGDWVRADGHLVSALDLLGPEGDPGLRARVLVDRSAIAHRAGGPGRAEALAEEALALAETAADPAAIARAEDLLGIVARSRGDLAAAMGHLDRAISVLDAARASPAATVRGGPASGGAPAGTIDGGGAGGVDAGGVDAGGVDPGVRVAALNTLALVCADLGDRGRAIGLIDEALILCERQGDRHRQAALENNLADLLRDLGRPDEAMAHLKRAVGLFADVGGRPGELEPEIWKLVEW
jgi:DNA-binding SARP family transcriptional activator